VLVACCLQLPIAFRMEINWSPVPRAGAYRIYVTSCQDVETTSLSIDVFSEEYSRWNAALPLLNLPELVSQRRDQL
jgi:hypothetical protein